MFWATFSDAADEAGISRHFGEIHFIDGDLEARKLGRVIAQNAWKKTLQYFGDKDQKHDKEDDHGKGKK